VRVPQTSTLSRFAILVDIKKRLIDLDKNSEKYKSEMMNYSPKTGQWNKV